MATKIDAAAEKAYAEAAAKTAVPAPAKADPVVPAAPAAVTPAPVKAAPVKAAPVKPAAAKAAPKKAAVTKSLRKPATTATTPRIASKAAPAPQAAKLKDTIMTKAKTTAADFTVQMKDGLAAAQERAKAAYDKGTELAAEMGEFSKGNLEAVVESGKILASGVQTIARTQFEDAKSAVETMTGDLREMAAVKSPTDFVQLQGKIASRNFDAAVAQLSKTTEAWVKLANDSFAPLSSRAAVAMEKVRKAA